MNNIPVIFNPAARGEKARRIQERIEALCGPDRVRVTRGPGEARALAELAVRDGAPVVVAAGGDGTINEVVNGIAGSGVTLGLLPTGTMNVFASELGLPSGDLCKCWEIILRGKARQIDLGQVVGYCEGHHGSHAFVQMGGIGFDAQIVQETRWEFRKNFGPLSYLISGTQIAARRPPRLIIESGGKTTEGSFVLVGNGRFYGGPFVVFKEARIDDGRLDVLIFKNLGFLDIVRYLQAIIFGTHTDLGDVDYFQAAHLRVHTDEAVPVEVDGEVIGNAPAEFRLMPKGLRVLV